MAISILIKSNESANLVNHSDSTKRWKYVALKNVQKGFPNSNSTLRLFSVKYLQLLRVTNVSTYSVYKFDQHFLLHSFINLINTCLNVVSQNLISDGICSAKF